MLKQNRIGEPIPLKKVQGVKKKGIKEIKGIAAAYRKAPAYALRLESDRSVRVYVTMDGKLDMDKTVAKKFKEGFDDPEVKRKFWMSKLGVKLITERL